MTKGITQQLLKGAAFIIVLLPLSWLFAYVLFWMVQRVPVDFRPFWSWLRMVINGAAGEAPSSVAFIAEAIFVFLIVVTLVVRYRRGRKQRAAGGG